jgi:transcriptional regulator with XRE-family HTH domain
MANQPREKTAETLGANVKYLREHASISQTELARRMTDRGWPWHQSTVYRVESGRQAVRFDEARDLADLLGVTLDRLTWAIGEAAEQELAEVALNRLHEAAGAAINAIVQLYAARAAAEQAAREASRSEHAHVREAAAPLAEGLMWTALESVVSSAEQTWEQRAEELDPADTAAGDANRILWRGDIGKAELFWDAVIRNSIAADPDDPLSELLSTIRQTEAGRAGLAKIDQGRLRRAATEDFEGASPEWLARQQRLIEIGRQLFGERGPTTEEEVDQVVKHAKSLGIKARRPHTMLRISDLKLEVITPAEAMRHALNTPPGA